MSERKDAELALLADLVSGVDPTDSRFARAEALLADEASRAEVDEHRRLVALLKEHAPPSSSPDWRALEASIQRACAAEQQRSRSWRSWLRAWRWPVLALGTAAAAAAALAWLRTEAPIASPTQVAATRENAPAQVAAPETPNAPGAPGALDVIDAWAALPEEAGWLDEPDDLAAASDESSELLDGSDEQALPRAAAITLGLAEEELPREEGQGAELGADSLEPGEPWLEELQQIDGESLQRLDAWLDASKQKG